MNATINQRQCLINPTSQWCRPDVGGDTWDGKKSNMLEDDKEEEKLWNFREGNTCKKLEAKHV